MKLPKPPDWIEMIDYHFTRYGESPRISHIAWAEIRGYINRLEQIAKTPGLIRHFEEQRGSSYLTDATSEPTPPHEPFPE